MRTSSNFPFGNVRVSSGLSKRFKITSSMVTLLFIGRSNGLKFLLSFLRRDRERIEGSALAESRGKSRTKIIRERLQLTLRALPEIGHIASVYNSGRLIVAVAILLRSLHVRLGLFGALIGRSKFGRSVCVGLSRASRRSLTIRSRASGHTLLALIVGQRLQTGVHLLPEIVMHILQIGHGHSNLRSRRAIRTLPA